MPMLSRSKKVKKAKKLPDDTQESNYTLNYSLGYKEKETPTRPSEDEASRPSESASFNFAVPESSKEEVEDDRYFKYLDEEMDRSTQNSSIFEIPAVKDAYVKFVGQTERPSTPFPEEAPQDEKLEWLHNHRNTGLYVLCDKCNKLRYLEDVVDPLELPKKWFCHMNPDKTRNKCSIPQDEIATSVVQELVNNEYNAGSIVYAKVEGYPWWPAMVDDDPDVYAFYWLEEMSDDPTYYHVTFFDSQTVTRAWVKPNALMSFKAVEDGICKLRNLSATDKKLFESRLTKAKAEARKALDMSLIDRLKKYNYTAQSKASGNKKKAAAAGKKNKTDGKNKKAKKVTFALNVSSEIGAANKKAAKRQNEKKDLKNKNKREADKYLIDELKKFAREEFENLAEMMPPKKRTNTSKTTQEKARKAPTEPKNKKFKIDQFIVEHAESIVSPEMFSDDDSSHSGLSDLVVNMF